MRNLVAPILKSYSAILFTSNALVGLALLVLTFLNPNLGFGGLISVISAYLFARLLGFKREFLRIDYYIYNPLLVGLSLGYLFKISAVSLLFFVIAGIISFLLTYFLATTFSYYLRLPVLSLPFVAVSSLLYLASSKFTNLFVINLYPHTYPEPLPLNLPLFLEGYLKSLGAIFFSPYVQSGLLIALLLFLSSRILFFLSLVGYFGGAFFQTLLSGSYYASFSDISAFNYILSAMALGGVFLIPSLKSYKFALLASLIAVPLSAGVKVFWESYSIPAFALPFNMVVALLLYALIALGHEKITRVYKGTPERTLDYYLAYLKRFPFTGREVSPPFSGRWLVWQSFDDEWTHKGAWKHALDFVITDEEGKTYKNDGYYLTDYYAFGKPVLSPVDGEVVEVVSDVPDNPPGTVNKENNWGNYVLIYDKRGFYVLLAHFRQNSIAVKVGQRVVKGALLGQCGNSGYSPQPHIHLHAQLVPNVGAPTIPFSLSSYVEGERFVDAGVPKRGIHIEPVYPDKGLFNRLNLMIDQKFIYSVEESGSSPKRLELTVKMAPDGTFYLTDGASKLYFGIKNSTFYFYHFEGSPSSYLKYFFFSASKIPLIPKRELYWEDYLPLLALTSSLKRELFLFLASFFPDRFEIKLRGSFKGNDEIGSVIYTPSEGKKRARVVIAKDYAFEEIEFGEKIRIRRIRE